MIIINHELSPTPTIAMSTLRPATKTLSSNDNIDKVRLDLRLLVCKDFGVTDPRNRLDLDIEHWISLVGRTTLNIVVIMIPDQLRADLHGHSLSAAARWSVQRQTTVLYQASQVKRMYVCDHKVVKTSI